MPTDVKFTGQRLDKGTGLYYYGARYYDPVIGRFISADTIIPNPADSQAYNRYSYCLNNPLKYVDPSGHIVNVNGFDVSAIYGILNDPQSLMMLAGSISNTVSETVGSEEYQAYTEFRNEYNNEASVFENSELEYVVTSETSSVDDLHITNTQDIYDSFVLMAPYAGGSVHFSVVTEWHQGNVNISVSSYVSNVNPISSTIFTGATVKKNGPDPFIVLSEPDYAYWKTDTTSKYTEGTYTLRNGFTSNKIELGLSVTGQTNNPDISDYQIHNIGSKSSWTVTLWEGY